jgi:predicted RNA-binding Zn-ribbon protein involved in translation (DUF1610 family)
MNKTDPLQSLVVRTGQARILLIEHWSVYLGLFLMVAPLLLPKASAWIIALPVTGLVVGVGGFVYACTALRCPQCGHRWFWEAVRRRSPLAADQWVLSLSACPSCGFAGNDEDSSSAQR